jgi:hypothetical protein
MQQNNQQINIDLSNAEDVPCRHCENLYFSPIVMLKKLSAILSPTGEEIIFPVNAIQCNNCKEVETPF